MKGKWEALGATEHSKDFHGQFNWLHPKALAKLPNMPERKIRESLKINNLETKAEYDKNIRVLNRDRGYIVNTNLWKPLIRKINMVRHANAMKCFLEFVLTILYTYVFVWNNKQTSHLTIALAEWLVPL